MDIISNVPATLEWRIYTGDTAIITIIVQDDAGNNVSLDGYTFVGQVREEPTSPDIIQSLDISVSDSVLTVDISDTTILPRISYFDIQATKPDLTITTILKGYIYTEDDVTR